MGEPLKVYISAPYTKGDVAVNVRRAVLTADILALKGFIPYVPHLSHFWHLIYPHPVEFWYAYDLEWLKVCDVVLRLPGESTGADAEVELAQKLGKPVYFHLQDLLKEKGS